MKKVTSFATLAIRSKGFQRDPAGLYEISDPIDSTVTLDSSKEYLLTEVVMFLMLLSLGPRCYWPQAVQQCHPRA